MGECWASEERVEDSGQLNRLLRVRWGRSLSLLQLGGGLLALHGGRGMDSMTLHGMNYFRLPQPSLGTSPNSFSLPDHPNLPRPSSSLPSKRKSFSNIGANANLALFSHSAPRLCTTQFYNEADVLSTVLTSSRLSKLDV